MAQKLKDRCEKYARSKHLSDETTQLLLKDAQANHFRTLTYDRVFTEVGRLSAIPDWLLKYFVDAIHAEKAFRLADDFFDECMTEQLSEKRTAKPEFLAFRLKLIETLLSIPSESVREAAKTIDAAHGVIPDKIYDEFGNDPRDILLRAMDELDSVIEEKSYFSDDFMHEHNWLGDEFRLAAAPVHRRYAELVSHAGSYGFDLEQISELVDNAITYENDANCFLPELLDAIETLITQAEMQRKATQDAPKDSAFWLMGALGSLSDYFSFDACAQRFGATTAAAYFGYEPLSKPSNTESTSNLFDPTHRDAAIAKTQALKVRFESLLQQPGFNAVKGVQDKPLRQILESLIEMGEDDGPLFSDGGHFAMIAYRSAILDARPGFGRPEEWTALEGALLGGPLACTQAAPQAEHTGSTAQSKAAPAPAANHSRKSKKGRKAAKGGPNSKKARLERALKRLFELRRTYRMKGIRALIAEGMMLGIHRKVTSPFELSFLHGLLVAGAIELMNEDFLSGADLLADLADKTDLQDKPAGAFYLYWHARRFAAFSPTAEGFPQALGSLFAIFEGDATRIEYTLEAESRFMKQLFGRRYPSHDAIRLQRAIIQSFYKQRDALSSARPGRGQRSNTLESPETCRALGEAARAAREALSEFMPADRGAHWLAAMIEVNAGDPESAFFGPLSDESKLDPDPEIFNRLWNFSIAAPHSRLYNIMRTETISFDEYIKNAHMKGALTANTLLTTPLEVGQGLYARIYDLPWFAEVEKNIGRILRHFRLSDQIDVIEVENSANPDLIHFITTSLSRQLFADDGTEDHEYFITVSKKVFCQPKNRKGRKGEIERLIPEAKPLSKLEEAALSILQELAESACTSAATGYERDVLVTNSPNDDELPEDAAHGEGYNPIFDSHLPDAGRFLSKEFFKPFAEGLPYPALVACDAEKYSRFKPFEYVAPGRTRRMTFTECIPLYPEELQFASDYSLEELFDKWGFDTFSPIPTKRKNVAEEFFKGALIDPKKIRPLLPEGVEDADCFVSVKVLREGARIGCCMHLLMPGADHALWMFRAEGEETDNMSDPACWRATTLNTVCNYDPDVRFILDAPPGSAFSRSPEGTFVKNELEEAFLDAFESEYDEALDDAFTEILNSPEDLEAFRNQLEAVFEGGLADATADSAAKHNLSEEEIHEFKSMFREAFNDACSEVLGKSAHLEPMGEKPQSEWSDSLSEEAKKALADAEILQMLAGGHAGHGNGSGRRDN